MTQDAAAVLTPRYAAPEQVLGQPVSTATDVYSAGVVLYELLTGALPYAQGEANLLQIMHAVAQAEPRPPGLSTDLDTVLLKALAKDPTARYASIERMAEDLRRVLVNEPILARRVPWWQRLALFVRRHRRATAASAAAGVLLVVASALALQQRMAGAEQRARADAVRDFMFDMLGDVEADETAPDADVTGAQIVAAALKRARAEFTRQPQLQAELLGELGRIDMRLGRLQRARGSLQDAVLQFERVVGDDDPALNKARAHLASLLADDDEPGAQALATRVLQACAGTATECVRARSYAHGALRNLHGQAGRVEPALEHARAAVADSQATFGARDPSTVLALEALAIMARNAGRLPEAGQAIELALQGASGLTLRAAGRLSLQRTRAVIQLDLGHHAAARDELAGLVPRVAHAQERAVTLRLLANALLIGGEAAPAGAAATRSLADSLAAELPQEQLLAQEALGRAWALQGQGQAGAALLAHTAAAWRAMGFAEDTLEVARVERHRAEALLRHADLAGAEQLLGSLVPRVEAAGPRLAAEAAHVMDLLGCLARARQQAVAAAALHERARVSWSRLLPAGHPYLLRNAVYAAMAAAADGPAPEATLAALAATLARDSVWAEPLRALRSRWAEAPALFVL